MSGTGDFPSYGWVAWLLTIITWIVAFLIHSITHRKNNINATIDEFRNTVKQLEEKSLEFWVNNHLNVYEFQLQILFKRLAFLAQEIQHFDGMIIPPNNEITELRKAVLLFGKGQQRPLSPNSTRVKEIIGHSFKLFTYYKKLN